MGKEKTLKKRVGAKIKNVGRIYCPEKGRKD